MDCSGNFLTAHASTYNHTYSKLIGSACEEQQNIPIWRIDEMVTYQKLIHYTAKHNWSKHCLHSSTEGNNVYHKLCNFPSLMIIIIALIIHAVAAIHTNNDKKKNQYSITTIGERKSWKVERLDNKLESKNANSSTQPSIIYNK